jgi:hypothetical protein
MRSAPFQPIDEYPLTGQGKAEFDAAALSHPLAVGIRRKVLVALLEACKGRCDFFISAKTISRRIGVTEATAAFCINELASESGPLAVVLDRSVRVQRRIMFRQHRNFRSFCLELAERGLIRHDSPWLGDKPDLLKRLDPANPPSGQVARDDHRKAGCVSYSWTPPPGFLS